MASLATLTVPNFWSSVFYVRTFANAKINYVRLIVDNPAGASLRFKGSEARGCLDVASYGVQYSEY